MRPRTLYLAGLLLALLVAGVGSYYASTHPDGLMHVADKAGFGDTAKHSPANGSPFAGYSTKGVHDGRVGRGLAGVIGTTTVLVLGSGLFLVLRRRRDADSDGE